MDAIDECDRAPRPSAPGTRPYAPTAVLQPTSESLRVDATNLLERARAVLEQPNRARRLIEHAVDLPFDDCERIYPAVAAAQYNLYESICEAVELLEEADGRWVDAVLGVYRSTNGPGRVELARALAQLIGEGAGNRRQHRQISAAIEGPDSRDAAYDDPPVGRENQIEYVESLLRTEIEFDDAFNDLLAG